MDLQTAETENTCKYCQKSYKKLSTLTSHLCEPKRRWQQEKDTGVQFGFRAFLRFYEMSQGSAKFKTYADFVDSPYYSAFVKFGQYCVSIRAVNVTHFTDWLLKNNKKLDHWCKDKLYEEWLVSYIKRESVQDALERSLKEMQEYADSSTELEHSFNNYFKLGNANRICQHISSGRVSPWIIFNCSSGIEFLDTLNQQQLTLIMPYIDPSIWQQKLKDYAADTEWVKDILAKAGL